MANLRQANNNVPVPDSYEFVECNVSLTADKVMR